MADTRTDQQKRDDAEAFKNGTETVEQTRAREAREKA